MTPQSGMTLDDTSHVVQAHLGVLQSIIQRMAANSTSCKAWCITLVSAVLVIGAERVSGNAVFIAFIPTLLFATLDAYYLSLERHFRKTYAEFVRKLQSAELEHRDLYEIGPAAVPMSNILSTLKSLSIWPFYAMLSIMILGAKFVVLAD